MKIFSLRSWLRFNLNCNTNQEIFEEVDESISSAVEKDELGEETIFFKFISIELQEFVERLKCFMNTKQN